MLPSDTYSQPNAADPVLEERTVLDIVRRHVVRCSAVTRIDETGGEARVYVLDDNLVLKVQRPHQLRPRTSLAKEAFFLQQLAAYPDIVVPHVLGYGRHDNIEYIVMTQMPGVPALTVESPVKATATRYFDRFGAVSARLRAIAERERRKEPLTADDLDYLNHMVSVTGRTGGYGNTEPVPGGWYVDLYYDQEDLLTHKPIIADVHTQPTDENGNDVGRVLHVGTSYPRMFVVTIRHDGGKYVRTYRGFVSAYLEKITEHYQRLTDEDWANQLEKAPPPPPVWLQSLLP